LFLISLKIRLGNRLLALLGSVTLELYLMHGMFVEMFGYDFLEIAPSLHYIKDVPLYIAVVFACSVPLTFIYHVVWKKIVKALAKKG
jgi:peptidoglycan/LPS O-acetylase OafA/YrhL